MFLTTGASVEFLDDEALIQRILDHLARGSTDLAGSAWSEPVANYRSPDRLRREVELALRRRPVPFCPSAALPHAGTYLARDAAGVPIVAIRGRDGQVRAFRNMCRHRGTQLVADCGRATSLVCPYHGWVYGLDGELRHVPDEYGFPGLDRGARGLHAVPTAEGGGMVFVSQDAPIDLGEFPRTLDGDEELVDSTELEVEANWKVLTEGFLEGYHLKATHRSTFFPFGYDNVTVIEHSGRHSRVTFPFRRIERLRDAPPGEREIGGLVTTVHHLFPNVVVARLSHHTTMVVMEPVNVERTRLIIYRLAGPAGDGSVSRERAVRDADFVEMGNAEDRDMARAVQRGLAGAVGDTLEFGLFEGALTHFHRQLHDLLDEDGDDPRPTSPEPFI